MNNGYDNFNVSNELEMLLSSFKSQNEKMDGKRPQETMLQSLQQGRSIVILSA